MGVNAKLGYEKEFIQNRVIVGFARDYRELDVYQSAMDAAVEIFEITGEFPKEERYSLVDQIRRSSRSVCANIAEAWRKRRYRKAFISKLSDAEAEASETQVWLEFAGRFGYLEDDVRGKMELNYDKIISQIITMISNADKWVIGGKDIE